MDSEKFGKLIKELRKQKKLTQKELGEKLHITDKAISKWERGLSIPDITMINKLAEIFEISVSELISGNIGNKEEINVEKVLQQTKQEKTRKNIITIIVVTIILITATIFAFTIGEEKELNYETDPDFKQNLSIIGNRIAEPDRIVYRNEKGKYIEFIKGSKEYEIIEAIIGNSIDNYKEYGQPVTQKQLDEIHQKTFVEFDYNTISKNYCIPLENEEDSKLIKLSNEGGNVFSSQINNINKIKRTLEDLSTGKQKYELEYKQEISKNTFEEIGYDKIKKLKTIEFNSIYQTKIEDFETYETNKEKFKIEINEKITEETFENNIIILTISKLPKINIEVNLGNIKYTYDTLPSEQYDYNIHVLIVSKIVNSNCIYNTNLNQNQSNN